MWLYFQRIESSKWLFIYILYIYLYIVILLFIISDWQKRVILLQEQRKIAESIQAANDPNYDPFAAYKQGGRKKWMSYVKKLQSWFFGEST